MNYSVLTPGAGGMSRRVGAWSVKLILALVAGLIFAIGASEEAHAVSKEKFRQFGSLCVGERSSTDEESDGVLYGESATRPLAYSYYYGPCSLTVSKPAGYLSGRVFVYKWSDRWDEWYVCRQSGWLYNGGSSTALRIYVPLGDYGDRWCGRGWYGTEAQGSVWHNGKWRTTRLVWSGSDYYY